MHFIEKTPLTRRRDVLSVAQWMSVTGHEKKQHNAGAFFVIAVKSKFWLNWKVIHIWIGRPPSFYAGMENLQLFWSFVFTSRLNIHFCCFVCSFFFCRLMPHEKVFRYKKVRFSRKEGRKSSTDNRKITQKKGQFVDYYWKKKPLLTCVQEMWTTTTK